MPCYLAVSRDRAKERREGVAVADSEEVQGISIEHSKYLGGDVEHTHLVKGLDYALLHQVGVSWGGAKH